MLFLYNVYAMRKLHMTIHILNNCSIALFWSVHYCRRFETVCIR